MAPRRPKDPLAGGAACRWMTMRRTRSWRCGGALPKLGGALRHCGRGGTVVAAWRQSCAEPVLSSRGLRKAERACLASTPPLSA